MTPKPKTGLIVGKFSPLHLGHEALIRFGLAHCERLILLSWSLPEFPGYEAGKRRQWLAQRFPHVETWVLTPENITCWPELGKLPPNQATDAEHRHFVARFCLHVLKMPVDIVFTAENYGDSFAQALQQLFSQALQRDYPVSHWRLPRLADISGTAIRAAPGQSRLLVAPEIYQGLIKKVALLGGESSGKSNLSSMLAQHYHTQYAAEYGREHWAAKAGQLCEADMLIIARQQVMREDALMPQSTGFLFCDTTPLTTRLYSDMLFNEVDPLLQALAKRPYDYTFLCAPDFPFVQDGTRVGEAFRHQQHERYKTLLSAQKQPYVLLTGSIKARIQQIQQVIERQP